MPYSILYAVSLLYAGREIPRPGQWNTDVITWTRLVFRRPQLAFSEGDDKPRSRESPPPSPGHAYDEEEPQNGISNMLVQFPNEENEEHPENQHQEGEEYKSSTSAAGPVNLPPPVVASVGQPLPVTEEILPPPGEFSGEEEETSEGSTAMGATPRNNVENRAAGPRAVSEPPRPTPSMEESSSDRTVQQGLTLQLPPGDNQYLFSPPK